MAFGTYHLPHFCPRPCDKQVVLSMWYLYTDGSNNPLVYTAIYAVPCIAPTLVCACVSHEISTYTININNVDTRRELQNEWNDFNLFTDDFDWNLILIVTQQGELCRSPLKQSILIR
jgi:hypothetical protein